MFVPGPNIEEFIDNPTLNDDISSQIMIYMIAFTLE